MVIAMNARRFGLALVVGLGAAMAMPGARAQGAAPGEPPETIQGLAFAQFIESRAYVNQLVAYTIGYEKRLGPCREPEIRRRLPVMRVRSPVRFAAIGIPPQWLEIFQIGGCGGVYRRRIFTAYFNNKVQHAALLSGSSRAGPRLQWDIVRALLPVARASARKRGCPARSVRLLKAELDGAASDAARAPWNETWTVSDCAGSHDYAISFKPDPKGGATWAAKAK